MSPWNMDSHEQADAESLARDASVWRSFPVRVGVGVALLGAAAISAGILTADTGAGVLVLAAGAASVVALAIGLMGVAILRDAER